MSQVVLITGAFGYLGGRIVRTLEQAGLDLTLVLGARGSTTAKCLPRGSRVVSLDVTSQDQCDAACRGVRCVVHLASIDEVRSQEDPDTALLVNTLGTAKLLRAAERAGVERFIYFSTAHVYGSPLQGVITEDLLPRPMHPYAITHRAAEDFVLAAHAQQRLAGVVLRLSNAIGPPGWDRTDRWTLVANDLCRQVITNNRLVLRTDGMQWRDFVALEDVARAVVFFLLLRSDRFEDGLFNLGRGVALRVRDLAQMIAERAYRMYGLRPELVTGAPSSPGVVAPLEYRVHKLRSLGFVATESLESEIDAMLRYCAIRFGRRGERL